MKLPLLMEIGASIFTLFGVLFGTTMLAGAICYGFGLIFWWYILVHKKLFGLLPYQTIITFITLYNLMSCLHIFG